VCRERSERESELGSLPRTPATNAGASTRSLPTGQRMDAASADIPFVEVSGLLDLDVDTPEDLLLAEAVGREALHAD